MRRSGVLVAVVVWLALAGCSGSSSTSSTSTTSSNTASTAPSASSTSTTTSTASRTATRASLTTTTTPAGASDTNVRLPAKFTIRTGGTLFPPVVAAPKHTTIVLSVRSQDGRRHTLALRSPHPYTVSVGPGGPARLVLKGLANGAYVVTVDGAVRGRLIVGATPGP